MRVIFPIPVDDATLVSSNLTEDDHDDWSSAVSYVRGSYVISKATHTVYRSLTDANLANDPDLEFAAFSDPLITNPGVKNWVLMGATNLWRLFDGKPSQTCQSDDGITVEMTPNIAIGAVSGFNVDAANISVKVFDGENIVYDENQDLIDETGVIDALKYYTLPYLKQTEFAFLDLPILMAGRVVVTFTGGQCSVGQLVVGGLETIGRSVTDGSGFSIMDFSRINTDDYGNVTTVQGAAVKVSEYPIVVGTQQLQFTYEKFNKLRGGQAVVWIGPGGARVGSMTYGYFRSFSNVYQTRDYSEVSIQVQGIA